MLAHGLICVAATPITTRSYGKILVNLRILNVSPETDPGKHRGRTLGPPHLLPHLPLPHPPSPLNPCQQGTLKRLNTQWVGGRRRSFPTNTWRHQHHCKTGGQTLKAQQLWWEGGASSTPKAGKVTPVPTPGGCNGHQGDAGSPRQPGLRRNTQGH